MLRGNLDAPLVPSTEQHSGEEEALSSLASRPYLLLDIRSEQSFNRGHIKTAFSLPATTLRRCIDGHDRSRLLLRFKNREGKIIVICGEDEESVSGAQDAAAGLIQRGYDNVFLLSGGLKVTRIVFPDGLVTGNDDDDDEVSMLDVETLEARLEEMLNSGGSAAGRLSSFAPSVSRMKKAPTASSTRQSRLMSSRMSRFSSQPNLTSKALAGKRS